MNRLSLINCPENHAFVTWLFREARRGRFPSAYALTWADSGVELDELTAIGVDVEEVLRGRRTHCAKGNSLGRVGVRAARRFGVGWPDENHPQRDLVSGIFYLADQEHTWATSGATQGWAALPGYIAGAVELALASDLTTIDELMANPEGLAEAVVQAAKANGISVSRTDVLDTLRYGMTCFGPITDWVLPEEVERLRAVAHAWLLELLRSRGALKWLSEFLNQPGAGGWLIGQMRAPEERDLLRGHIAELCRKRATNRPRA